MNRGVGHVYALAFGNGDVKVGRTRNVKRRLARHRYNARKSGLTITSVWVSPLHLERDLNEETLKKLAAKFGGTPLSPEYFNGTDYATLVSTATTLPFTPAPARITEARMYAIRSAALDVQVRLTANADLQKRWELLKATARRRQDKPKSAKDAA